MRLAGRHPLREPMKGSYAMAAPPQDTSTLPMSKSAQRVKGCYIIKVIGRRIYKLYAAEVVISGRWVKLEPSATCPRFPSR